MYLKVSGSRYSPATYNTIHYILGKIPGESEAFNIRNDFSFFFFFADGTQEQLDKLLSCGFQSELVTQVERMPEEDEADTTPIEHHSRHSFIRECDIRLSG